MKKCAAVMLYNSHGEMALQVRSATDYRYPSRYDFAAGGHMDDGESPEKAAQRELKEELGIEAPLEFVTAWHHPGGSDPDDEADDLTLFKTVYDGSFTPDPKEVDRVEFFTPEQVTRLLAISPEKFHPELLYFFAHHADKL